jgi:hypothetical protein
MKPLLEKGFSRLQQKRQLVAVAVGGRQPLEEEKVVACLVAEALDEQPMWKTMWELKARPSP